MTPEQLEQRLAKHEEKIEALENELFATEMQVQLLIGSHPDPTVLLSFVEASIRTGRTKLETAKKPAGLECVISRLETTRANIRATIEERERSRKKLAEEQQRRSDAKEQARADLGMGIGRGQAGGKER